MDRDLFHAVGVFNAAKHALMASSTGVVFATRPPVKVASAVGAGDSFVAALAVSLIKGEDDQTALRFAMAGAGPTLMTDGTSLFDPDTVHDLLRAVTWGHAQYHDDW